jgi:hypothetical protein
LDNQFLSCQINAPAFQDLRALLLYEDLLSYGNKFGLEEDFIKDITASRLKENENLFLINSSFADSFEKDALLKQLSKVKDTKDRVAYFKLLSAMTPAQKACLVPKIIFKYRYKKQGKFIEETLPFTQHINVEDILSMEYSRGDGNGIKSIQVEKKFVDPSYNIPNIVVNASFYFQSAAILNQNAKPGKRSNIF